MKCVRDTYLGLKSDNRAKEDRRHLAVQQPSVNPIPLAAQTLTSATGNIPEARALAGGAVCVNTLVVFK